MRVDRMASNQLVITQGDGDRFFRSYNKTIAKERLDGEIELDIKYYHYSKTTVKYRDKFLDMSSKEVDEAIKSGRIKMVDLNR